MANSGTRHGLNRAMTRVKLAGMDAIDRRTAPARALLAWREQLITDLGGSEHLSAQKLGLVELACRTKAIVDAADSWLLSQPAIVNKKRRALLPIVMQRQTLCDSLARLLSQLGLSRVSKPVKSLQEYIAERDRPRGPEAEEPAEIDRDKEPLEAGA
jgi:hypothetical protein